MPNPHPIKLKNLLKALKDYGVRALNKRGKGSELILILPSKKSGKKGPQYPIKNHGLGEDVPIPVINACLRRFEIDKKKFWNKY